MDGIHRSPLSGLAQSSRPRECAEVVGIAQCPVDIEKHPRAEIVRRHAGGSSLRFTAAWFSPVCRPSLSAWGSKATEQASSSGSSSLILWRASSATCSRCLRTSQPYPAGPAVNRFGEQVLVTVQQRRRSQSPDRVSLPPLSSGRTLSGLVTRASPDPGPEAEVPAGPVRETVVMNVSKGALST